MIKLTSVKVSLSLPYIGGLEGTWSPNDSERIAAWEMYVELITRVPIAELEANTGTLREALNSVYSLFETTRKILRTHGPIIAQTKKDESISFAYLAVAILNTLLRPLLSKCHPLLKEHEDCKPPTISSVLYEKQWDKYSTLREELDNIRTPLIQYSELLAQVAGVPSLIVTE